MNADTDAPTPYMRWVKGQSAVPVPLLQHLRAELGEERANDLVYPVLREYMKEWIAGFASKESENPVENFYKTAFFRNLNELVRPNGAERGITPSS